jgi:transcriptional regulator with XRE-family HTH domain
MSNAKKQLTIAQKIKLARKSVGLSQKELGEKLDLSDKAVSTYEVGRAVPSLETLREISKLTYKPLAYFMEEADPQQENLRSRLRQIEQELAEIKALLKEQS